MLLAEVQTRHQTLCLLSSHTVNKCHFCGLFSAMFFSFLCFFLVISLFKMATQHGAEVLFSVTNYKKAVMCLTEKIRVR